MVVDEGAIIIGERDEGSALDCEKVAGRTAKDNMGAPWDLIAPGTTRAENPVLDFEAVWLMAPLHCALRHTCEQVATLVFHH